MALQAVRVEGRIISGTLHFHLTPPHDGGHLGTTDAAIEIGVGLVREAIRLLSAAAEQEGFVVDVSYQQVIY